MLYGDVVSELCVGARHISWTETEKINKLIIEIWLRATYDCIFKDFCLT